jgi:hypothetical protein
MKLIGTRIAPSLAAANVTIDDRELVRVADRAAPQQIAERVPAGVHGPNAIPAAAPRGLMWVSRRPA